MSMTFKKKVLLWLHGLVGGVIGGASSGVLVILGAEFTGAADFTPRQLLTVAIVNAGISAALYLKKSPLPPIDEEDAPPTLGIGASGFTRE